MRITEVLQEQRQRREAEKKCYTLLMDGLLPQAPYRHGEGWDTTKLDELTEKEARKKLQSRWKGRAYYNKSPKYGSIVALFMIRWDEEYEQGPQSAWPDHLKPYAKETDFFRVAYLMDKFDIEKSI